MEITSLDTKDVNPPSTDSSTDSSLEMSRLNAVNENLTLNRDQEPVSVLPEGLLGLKLSHTKQKGDCLYIYSQDREAECAIKILEAIAPSTQNLESSILFAEGIYRLKLHGSSWALGVDLPIAQSAFVAAEVIADLLNNFRQDPKLAQSKLKLLLQNNCLNLLCETRSAILQAEMALPMLNTLRSLHSAEYFQSVTVSSRVIGQKKPSWSFEIDLLAIGLPSSNSELSPLEEPQDLNNETFDQEANEPTYWQKLGEYVGTFGQALLQFKWLGQTSPTYPKTLSMPVCIASLAIGIGTTIAIDRSLSYYAQPNEPTKLVVADPKINLQEISPEKGIPNKPALNFNIALFNEKLALLDWQIANKQRSPDVLIVGSSRALRGIDPNTLEKALIGKGYKGISVFNLGIDGATAKVVNLQITQILSRPQLPRMIVWADGLRAFNSSRSDITYDEITASTGYKQLQATLKNNDLNNLLSTNNTTDSKPSTPITQAVNILFATSTKRQEVRNSVVKSFDRNTHVLSNSESLIAATMPNTVTALDSKGFVAFDVTFDPNTYFQKFPQVPGDYDLDYRNFDISGSQFDAFANVIDFCRRNNIELLVVNMPLHTSYLDAIRSSYEATFNQRMQELSLREGFTYLDISHVIQNQAELFSDPSHLNKQGAIEIAKLLAQSPKIRWQSIKF
ncbi:MAG: hypothetical protein DCF19_06235 [Pseudanabaena frigida]|uniref:DUF1574 domain-containing protein n=1 Tax=Pseudanabaena frigida TaxID=945775 RepID=A0A2W4Y6R1_9CYAN|nr:MAG: hypothetical protein DCF19_06235 [Pseudanabaena frigida]